MRISDWSSDVCSSDLDGGQSDRKQWGITNDTAFTFGNITVRNIFGFRSNKVAQVLNTGATGPLFFPDGTQFSIFHAAESFDRQYLTNERSEEHTSELQSLMRISYAVFCLKTKNNN